MNLTVQNLILTSKNECVNFGEENAYCVEYQKMAEGIVFTI